MKVEEVKEKEEVVNEETVKEAVTENQQNEKEKKKQEEEVKDGILEHDSNVDVGTGGEKKEDADQTKTAEKPEVPITEVNNESQILKTAEQYKKCMETCSACSEKDEKFRTRDIEFTKIENVFKNKYKEMLENE
ncbi:hypothetical protein Hanom_Chr16g01427751 [Helianthus anomalus]